METNNNQLVERKSWFKRNWIWAMPVGGCLTVIIVTIVLMAVGIFAFADDIQAGMESQQQIIEQALVDANKNQEVITLLGEPLENNGSREFSSSLDNGVRNSVYSIPITGPQGTGAIQIMTHVAGEETVYDLYMVTIDGTNTAIDLKEESLQE